MRGAGDAGGSAAWLADRLEWLEHHLAWYPPGAKVGGEGIPLFGAAGRDQRFVGQPPSFTQEVRDAMGNASSRDHLLFLLGSERPVGYNAEHDAVSVLNEARQADLASFLECFGDLERHEIAERIRRSLGQDLRQRAQELGAGSDAVLRALRESFLLAELCWALGLDAARGASSMPVVVAAVEACATIGGTLLELSPVPDPKLDARMLQRIHHARTAWIGILLRFDEHADLIADGGARLNGRLVTLVGRSHDPERGRLSRFFHIFEHDPVPLVGPRLRTELGSSAEPDDRSEVARGVRAARRRAVELVEQEEEHRLLDVAARLLLPRYMVDEAVGLLQHIGAVSGRRSRAGSGVPFRRRWAWPLLPVAGAGILLFAVASLMLVVGLLERLLPGPTATAAAALRENLPFLVPLSGGIVVGVRWLLVLLAVVWVGLALVALYTSGRSASYLLLLRIPSATAFGLAILLALSFTWIGTQSGLGRAGPAVALLAAAVYSYVEFINQGGESRRPLRGDGRTRHRGGFGRIIEITVLAGGMSFLVATLVLEVFGRTLLTQVPNYELLADPVVYIETLAILASISLALGTFLQAIWDEQTITAPLSYLRLRG